MKITKLFNHYLLFLSILAFATNASAQTFTVESRDWLVFSETSYTVGAKYSQTAVTDGAIFTLPAPTTISDMHPDLQYCTKGYKIYKSGSNVVAETFSGGNSPTIYPVSRYGSTAEYFYMGPAIASDDAGTLWTHTMRGSDPTTTLDWEVGIHTFAYYTERPALGVPGVKKTINLDPLEKWMQNKAYLMSACGDGVNGTGYIWIAAESTKIARYTIVNGVVTAKDLYTSPLANGINPASCYTFVKQYGGNKIIYSTSAYDESTGTTTPQSIYRGTLSADGKSINWDSTPVVTDSYSPQVAVFTLSGHEILVYNSLDEAYDYSPYREITFYDMTAKSVISTNETIYVPSKNNHIHHSLNAVVVDEYNASVYGFIPGVGVYSYPIVATPDKTPVSNISVKCNNNLNYIGRQDATISWTAPESAKSYLVYYSSTYTNGAGATVSSDWAKIGETTNTSITHDDVCWATVLENDERKYYERSYIYKVIPVYDNGVLGNEATSSVLTPDFMPATPLWVDVDPVKDNKGYCIVSLLWKEWHGYGCQPHHYNVIRDEKEINYRNGELLEIGGSNYVDTTCVSGATYKYQIEAAYPGVTIPSKYLEYLKNEKESVTIATRDWSKPRYSISKVYEYKIVGKEGDDYAGYDGYVVPDATEFPNFYSEPDCYRQGVYYNGCWYIAQYTNDNTADKFQHNPQSTSTTLKGGILRFLGDDPRKEIPDDKEKYPSAYPQENNVVVANPIERRPLVSYHRENQCIAVDESGTFLTRGLRTGWSWNESSWEDNNNYALVCSSIEFHNFDENWHGSFDLPASLVADLEASAVDESLRAGDPTLPGRVDYFSAQGDLYNDDECYLYMAPMVSKTVFRVKLKKVDYNPYVVVDSWIKFTEDGTSPNFTYATENYAFPVNCEGRKGEEYVYEQLTNVYSLLSGDGTTQKQSASERAIYESSTFVNTIGGTTFEFNNELFLVAPQGQYPGNTGSFLVGMANRFAEKDDGSWTNNGAANADMTDIIPTAQWYTGKANTDATETNGLWIYAEQAKDENGNIIDENKDGMTDYAYIYTYRPGVMFGKYILTPNTMFPPTQVELSIEPQYATENEKNIDILRYDATASWSEVENYGTSGGNFYQIQGYTMSIYDVEEKNNGAEDGNDGKVAEITFDLTGENAVKLENGKVYEKVYDENGNALKDAEGNQMYEEIAGLTYTTYTVTENGEEKEYHTFSYKVENVDAVDDNCEKRDFIAYVTVNYEGVPGESTEGTLFNSAQTEYVAANAYIPKNPQATTQIYKETYVVKKDTDGDNEPDTDFQYYYIYMDVQKPESVDPVTNYTLTIDKGKGGKETVNSFYLYDPIDENTGKNYTGLTPDEDGYVLIEATYNEDGEIVTPATIPGTYDFGAARDALVDKIISDKTNNKISQQIVKWKERDNVDVNDDDGDNAPIDGELIKWNFIVNANYADTNPLINYTTSGGETNFVGVFTGIENVVSQSTFNLYPNPAETYFTIVAPQVIGTVKVLAIDGYEVKTVDINSTTATIYIDDIPKGLYIINALGKSNILIKK